jgi:hypothetical protein
VASGLPDAVLDDYVTPAQWPVFACGTTKTGFNAMRANRSSLTSAVTAGATISTCPIRTGSSAAPRLASPTTRSRPGGVAPSRPDVTRVQSCELRDGSKAGGGWDVTMLQDGELLFSRRCVDERGARYVAQSFRQDTVRAGWVDAGGLCSRFHVREPARDSARDTQPVS